MGSGDGEAGRVEGVGSFTMLLKGLTTRVVELEAFVIVLSSDPRPSSGAKSRSS